MRPDTQDMIIALLLRSDEFISRRLFDLEAKHFSGAQQKFAISLIHDFYSRYERRPLRKELSGEIESVWDDPKIVEVTWKKVLGDIDTIDQYMTSLYLFPIDPVWVEEKVGEHLSKVATVSFLNEQIQLFEDTGTINPIECIEKLEEIARASVIEVDIENLHESIDLLRESEQRDVICGSPWKTLNECYLDGGLARGEYGCVLAYPNIGKSSILAAIGSEALLWGKNVLHVSIEDSRDLVRKRYVASLTGVPRSRMKPDMSLEKAITIYKNMVESCTLGKLHILELEEYSKKASDLLHIIPKIERRNNIKIDLVILDYLQLMRPEKSEAIDYSQGDFAALEDTHRMFRRVLKKLNLAGWSVLQAKETDMNRVQVLKLHNIGKARATGQVPDILLSLNETVETTEDGMEISKLYVARNRLGPKYGVLNLKTDKDCCRYEEISSYS